MKKEQIGYDYRHQSFRRAGEKTSDDTRCPERFGALRGCSPENTRSIADSANQQDRATTDVVGGGAPEEVLRFSGEYRGAKLPPHQL